MVITIFCQTHGFAKKKGQTKCKKTFKKSPFFIAEISANHNGSLKNAKKLIYHAKKFGADAVKLQTYSPDLITIKSTNIDKEYV